VKHLHKNDQRLTNE